MKRILITGGAGFIGAHLCRRLLKEGNTVTVIDDFSTGSEAVLAGISHDGGDGIISWYKCDVRDAQEEIYDEIYNLACPASPVAYQLDPIQTTLTNVLGAKTVLDIARGGAKILQASTSEVYGDPQVHPQTEDYCGNVNPIGPRSCYDEGKRCAESLFFDYHRQHGVRIKVARIFNTYGPGMAVNDGRVVSNFICQALRGEPITIYGDGTQTRSFCYVDDMVEGLVRLMATGDDFTGPVNLGVAAEITVSKLARMVNRIAGTKSPIMYKGLPADDPVRRCPNRDLAFKAFGWEPTTSFDKGLDLTIAYFRDKLAEAA